MSGRGSYTGCVGLFPLCTPKGRDVHQGGEIGWHLSIIFGITPSILLSFSKSNERLMEIKSPSIQEDYFSNKTEPRIVVS